MTYSVPVIDAAWGRDEEGNEVRYFPWLRRAPDRDAAE
jgi:hypothetical protein